MSPRTAFPRLPPMMSTLAAGVALLSDLPQLATGMLLTQQHKRDVQTPMQEFPMHPPEPVYHPIQPGIPEQHVAMPAELPSMAGAPLYGYMPTTTPMLPGMPSMVPSTAYDVATTAMPVTMASGQLADEDKAQATEDAVARVIGAVAGIDINANGTHDGVVLNHVEMNVAGDINVAIMPPKFTSPPAPAPAAQLPIPLQQLTTPSPGMATPMAD